MKSIQLLIALPCLLLASLSPAQDKEPDAGAIEAARELFKVTDMEDVLDGTMESAMDAQMQQMRQLGIGEEGLKELKTEMLKFIKEIMPWEELEPEMVRVYATHFTKTELEELTAFYKTPTGQKAIKLTPQLMSEGMKMGQEKMMARMGELQQRIAPIIEKHLKPQ